MPVTQQPRLRAGRDKSDLPILRPPEYVNHYSMVNGAARAITIPAGAGSVFISSSAPYYIKYNKNPGDSVAVVPVGDVTDGSGQEYCPVWRDIGDFTELSIICQGTVVMTLSFYAP